MKQKLVSQEKKFKKWETNFRNEIPQQIDETLKKRIVIEVEKKLIDLEAQGSRYHDSKNEEFSGKKTKIQKIIQIEDENERIIVQKVIDERVKEKKGKKANEEEIKRKYKYLIQAEVRKALTEQSDADSSSSSEGHHAVENMNPGSFNRVLKQRQYNSLYFVATTLREVVLAAARGKSILKKRATMATLQAPILQLIRDYNFY